MTSDKTPLIERWFPVAAVDEACGTPAGSGRNEKAIFTWFASRPIAQARAAVLTSLLRVGSEDDLETDRLRHLVDLAIRNGDTRALEELATEILRDKSEPPVVLDCFSGRGIIPLEAARVGARVIGTDLSPVAALASRLLADWPLRDWSAEPDVPFEPTLSGADDDSSDEADADDGEMLSSAVGAPKLVGDLYRYFGEVDRRVVRALSAHYPRGPQGGLAWGYLWALTLPCDGCKRQFPLIGSMVLRHPYEATHDAGQSLSIEVDDKAGKWTARVHEGAPVSRPTMLAAEGKRGKSARCPFCKHVHPLDTVKAKGFSGQFEDAPLVAADLTSHDVVDTKGRRRRVNRKTFRELLSVERDAATEIDLESLPRFGDLSAAPTERIAPGNASTIDATGYGFMTFDRLMNRRQVLLFAATTQAIRDVFSEITSLGISKDYATALASYAVANLVRRVRLSTRGSFLRAHGNASGTGQNRNQVADLFVNESGVNFSFDWFETGIGAGPGTWRSLTTTTLKPLTSHITGLGGDARPARIRRETATSLPMRDGTVDAVICDPPYYEMINYADVSDLFYVWIRRCLFDIVPDLFGVAGDANGLQDKSCEIVVKQGKAPGDHRTPDWYERQLGCSFEEIRRVLKRDGVLTVVFGHSDPVAWRRLLGALRDAGFTVTGAWPARTEATNRGVASIRVTVTIGCEVAPSGRPTATAAQAEREIADLVRSRVAKWDEWGLALSDQLMAAYGPAMEVVGRYRAVIRPDGGEPDLDHFLTIGRRAVVEAHAFKVDELPFETFDAGTRFAIFWLRAFGRSSVNKGEAVFHAQSSQMRIDDVRPDIIEETKAGFVLALAEPPPITDRSPVIHVVRALAVEWPAGATEAAASVVVASGREVDDKHLWAMVAELVRQLPESDRVSIALTACQRNRAAIQAVARRQAPTVEEQLILEGGESS